jgi:hypothetical protein
MKDCYVKIRLTEKEKEEWQFRARSAGMNMSELVKYGLRSSYLQPKSWEELQKFAAELSVKQEGMEKAIRQLSLVVNDLRGDVSKLVGSV